MPSSAVNTNRVFLTAISYPEGMSHEDVGGLLAEPLGRRIYDVALKLRQQPPCIIGFVDRSIADGALRALIGAGGDGFAPSMADIESLGATLKIKDLRLGGSGLELALWRGPTITVGPSEVQVLVRGRMIEAQVTRRALSTGEFLNPSTVNLRTAPIAAGWGVGGAYGLALGLYSTWQSGEFRAEKTLVTSYKMDLHLADGRVLQIDGDKFGFQILGDQRGHSDNVNIDRMCEFLVHLAPEAVVDPYFALFHPPVEHRRLRLPLIKVNNDDPAFAFYSRWAALMYRHVMGDEA